MKGKFRAKQVFIVTLILAVAVVLFIGGTMLTTRYKTTIVDTYEHYYNKYYDQVSSYVEEGKGKIEKNIQLASQQDKK
ncbi:MAG: hypothetical protein ACI4RL_05700, partial [Ruminococcus sp.]